MCSAVRLHQAMIRQPRKSCGDAPVQMYEDIVNNAVDEQARCSKSRGRYAHAGTVSSQAVCRDALVFLRFT
jgi:hypothetical protein